MQTKEQFQQKLQEKLHLLTQCQKEHSVKSCSACEAYLSCTVRTQYVNSVYESMSLGQVGGFEF